MCLCCGWIYGLKFDRGMFGLMSTVLGWSCLEWTLTIFKFDSIRFEVHQQWLAHNKNIFFKRTVSALYICKLIVRAWFLACANQCVCPQIVTILYSKLPVVLSVPAVQTSYSHYVVHFPLLSGFTGVTVWYEYFVEQVRAVQTFPCWEHTDEHYCLCLLQTPPATKGKGLKLVWTHNLSLHHHTQTPSWMQTSANQNLFFSDKWPCFWHIW